MPSADPGQPRVGFFYGTLMAPKVLHRVCHGNNDPQNPVFAMHQFHSRPAVLEEHRRYRVRNADYPAILPCPGGKVRGTLVTGLTDADMWRLDIFEGNEYIREKVKVRPLVESAETDLTSQYSEASDVEAEVYVWKDPQALELDDEEWDFSEFLREKLRFWVGADPAEVYQEVDEAVAVAQRSYDGTRGRGRDGLITSALLTDYEKTHHKS